MKCNSDLITPSPPTPPPPYFSSQSNHTLAFYTPTFFNLKIETLMHQEFIDYIEHIIILATKK